MRLGLIFIGRVVSIYRRFIGGETCVNSSIDPFTHSEVKTDVSKLRILFHGASLR